MFLTVVLGAWATGLLAIGVFMVVALWRANVSWPLVFVPGLFVGAMLAYVATLLRWNAKAEEVVGISPAQLRRVRMFHPGANGERLFHSDGRVFVIWQPGLRRNAHADFEVWRMGPWSLGLVDGTKELPLLTRLTKHDVRRAGEALRAAGYHVKGFDAVA